MFEARLNHAVDAWAVMEPESLISEARLQVKEFASRLETSKVVEELVQAKRRITFERLALLLGDLEYAWGNRFLLAQRKRPIEEHDSYSDLPTKELARREGIYRHLAEIESSTGRHLADPALVANLRERARRYNFVRGLRRSFGHWWHPRFPPSKPKSTLRLVFEAVLERMSEPPEEQARIATGLYLDLFGSPAESPAQVNAQLGELRKRVF